MKSGSPNFLEFSGPLQARKGTALPLPYLYTCMFVCVCVLSLLPLWSSDILLVHARQIL